MSRYGQMLVEIGKRSELIPDVEEISLTSAILRLTRERPALACFTVGHGEPDINDTRPDGYEGFAAYLRQLGYGTEQLALGSPGRGHQARALHGGDSRAPDPAAARRARPPSGPPAQPGPPADHGRPRRRRSGATERAAAHNSPRAFGHDGAGGQIAWANPDTGLSFCYLTNGLDENIMRQKRRLLAIGSRAASLVATP